MLEKRKVNLEDFTYDNVYEELVKKQDEKEVGDVLFRILKKEKVSIGQTCVSTTLKKKRSQKKVLAYIKQKIYK